MSCSSDKNGDSAVRLAALRQEIDAVDDALHDLLMRRAELTRNMGALKGQPADGAPAANPVRPAREAAILRRLASRHRGEPPFAVVVRIWREVIAANLRRQCPFRLAVADCGEDLRDLARAEYGALTPAAACFRAEEVIGAVTASPGMLGILPAPALAPPEWRGWPELLAAADAPRILSALPLLADDGPVRAFAVGHAPAEPSGEDVSYVLLTGRTAAEADGLAAELAQAGLDGRIEAVWPAMTPPGLYCGFAAVQGFTPAPQIARLDDLRRRDGGAAVPVGAAPAPVRRPGAGAAEEDGP